MVGFWGVEENIRPPPLRRKKGHKIRTKYDPYFSDYSDDEVTFTSDEEEEKREIERVIDQRMEKKKLKEEQLKMLEEEMKKQSQALLEQVRRYNLRKNWMSSSSESDTSTDEDDFPLLNGTR